MHEIEESTCACRWHSHPEPIGKVLQRRGQVVKRTGDWTKTLQPDSFHTGLHGETHDQFRTLFGKSSFRSVLRKVTSARQTPVPRASLPELGKNVLSEYLEFLQTAGLVELDDDTVRATRPIPDIGSTVEWYVADLCERELAGSAAWGVRLDDAPVNGDFDVLAWLEPTLVYVETKTSPPGSIKVRALQEFLQRCQILSPEVAILLIDTEDDITPLFERLTTAMLPVLRRADRHPPGWRPDGPPVRQSKTFPTVYHGWPGIHVVNSKPSISTQLRRCLQHFHAQVKGQTYGNGRPTNVNFVTGSTQET